MMRVCDAPVHVVHDLAQRPLALRRMGELALHALGALPDLTVVVFDHELRVVLAAGEGLGLHRHAASELEGRLLAEVVPAARCERFPEHCGSALRGGRVRLIHTDPSSDRTYDVQIAPLVSEGEVVGGVAVARDATDQWRAEAALARSELHYRELAEQSSDVVSRSDEHGIYRFVSPSCRRVYGWEPEQMVGRPVTDFLHPDDRAAHRRVRDALRAGAPDGVAEVRTSRPDGTWVWVEARFRALREDDGRLHAVQVSCRDISDRKRAEEARRIADEQVRTSFDDALTGMALVALDGAFLRVNRAVCHMLGRSREQLLATTFQAITHPDDLDADVRWIHETVARRDDGYGYQVEKRYIRADDSIAWVLLSASLVSDPDGRPLHFVCQFQDISERKQMEDELHRLATHDDLTGLHNRRFFERALDQELRRSRRYGADAAVLMLDLDAFKDVNDALGHHAGDALLRHAAAVLSGRLRESDVVARLGGDEFAVLLPHTGAETAARIAADLERALAGSPASIDGAEVVARASIGIATLEAAQGADEALRAADRAMYRAKAARRRDAPPRRAD